MRILFIILLFLINSCATPYQPKSFGGGYSSIQLDKIFLKLILMVMAIVISKELKILHYLEVPKLLYKMILNILL